MEKLIDSFCNWPPFGQGFFLFLIALLFVGGIINIVKLFVVLFRGWPEENCCECEVDCCEKECNGKKN